MSETFDFGGQIVWRPTPEHIEKAHLTAFMRQHEIPDFDTLMRRSTEDVSWFTDAVLKYLKIEFYKPYTQVANFEKGIQWAEWCVGGQMNIVHNCVDKYIGTPTESKTAFIWEGEGGESRAISYGELHGRVNQAANALRSLGLGAGDAIGIYMPMIPENIVALLAIAKIGGVILPLFSGYGVSAVSTRLVDADAKALFTADGVFRRGKPVDMKSVADQAVDLSPTVEHVIVVNRIGLDLNLVAGRDHWWGDLVDSQPTEAATEITEAEDTLMVIYTSGTTGRQIGRASCRERV